MTPRFKSILVQLVGAVIAVSLLYLALKNVDFGGMWDAVRSANYWWIFPLIAVMLFSHFLRAWRWGMFLDALPEEASTGESHRVDLKTTFYAVMIGYMVNLAVPRLGEFARAANVSSNTGLRFPSVFGTVVVERLLDVVALMLILIGVGFIVAGTPAAERLLFAPLRDLLGGFDILGVLLVIVALGVGLGLILWLPSYLSKRHNGHGLLARCRLRGVVWDKILAGSRWGVEPHL